jgi:uncharacterized protein (TIGR04255 family)
VTQTPQTLPEYESPPINEVVCGIQFERLEKFLNPYLGMLWEQYKPEYSECQEVAPLMPAIEKFDTPAQVATPYVDVPPLPRTWFIRSEGNSLIQVQRDRFLHNWREIRPDDEYPRYHHIIEEFQVLFAKFTSFLEEHNIGVVIPLQYELTYINLIPQGQGWNTIVDVEKVFPNFTWQRREDSFLPSPETVNWNTNFILPEQSGRLHTRVQTALRRTDGLPFLRFELTARGIGEFNTLETMWNWFEVAHEYIVRGFAELTASEVQRQIWRRRK